jgi:hypothetical protein
MPLIFASSLLGLPLALARLTDSAGLERAAEALGPGGSLYLPVNVALIAFFNYYYTFLQVCNYLVGLTVMSEFCVFLRVLELVHRVPYLFTLLCRFSAVQLEPNNLSEQLKRTRAAIFSAALPYCFSTMFCTWSHTYLPLICCAVGAQGLVRAAEAHRSSHLIGCTTLMLRITFPTLPHTYPALFCCAVGA